MHFCGSARRGHPTARYVTTVAANQRVPYLAAAVLPLQKLLGIFLGCVRAKKLLSVACGGGGWAYRDSLDFDSLAAVLHPCQLSPRQSVNVKACSARVFCRPFRSPPTKHIDEFTDDPKQVLLCSVFHPLQSLMPYGSAPVVPESDTRRV